MALKPGIAAALLSIETTQEIREPTTCSSRYTPPSRPGGGRVHATGAIKVGSVVAFTGRYGLNHNGTIVRVIEQLPAWRKPIPLRLRVPLGSLMPA